MEQCMSARDLHNFLSTPMVVAETSVLLYAALFDVARFRQLDWAVQGWMIQRIWNSFMTEVIAVDEASATFS